ncbi:MAG: zinc-ribbon domain-containing protein [Proteobacteria bacterium]|nr:zinc-ribbon domain-containing protein [Pseudomonadota bacterium]MBU1232555.1 zinc-ribbon domain-containing protein [Pseudomonadota bacterium]MBU1418007.1 zinc-ribbon domain-containing protein [Pseudomonadota bacterium]MBU1455942.1 zinc-ribbon domain-containing protein [Pseudomonadota bacterium]
MRVIKCTECGTPISTKATACPKCGANPKEQIRRLGFISKVCLILLLLGLAGNLLNFCSGTSSMLPVPSPKQANEYAVE